MKVRLDPFPRQVTITSDNSRSLSDLRDLVSAAVSVEANSSSQRAPSGLMEVSVVEVEVEAVGEVVVGTLEAKTMASEDEEDPEEDVGVLPAKVAGAASLPRTPLISLLSGHWNDGPLEAQPQQGFDNFDE